MKVKTIGHYGIAFFEHTYEMEYAIDINEISDIFYKGEISELPYEKACKVAQIHPSAPKYYEMAMMPLFKGEGNLSKGTENPVMALESLKTKGQTEKDMPYILIWRMYGGDEEQELINALQNLVDKIKYPTAINNRGALEKAEEVLNRFN